MKRIYEVKNKKPLRENLQHILPEMYDDIMQYKHTVVSKPLSKGTLHAMRIAGKPLRYAMEIGEIAFGEEFKICLNEIKDTVEMMGDIHDADVMIPEIESQIREIRLFNATITAYKERISTRALRNIVKELRGKRKEMYSALCSKLNEWEKKNFRARLVKAMEAQKPRGRKSVVRPPHPTKSLPKAKAGGTRIPGKLKIPPLTGEGTEYKPPRIIKSKLLTQFSNIAHGMSTKIGVINEPPFFNNMSSKIGDNPEHVKTNREAFFGSLGITEEELAVPHQIHSSNILIIDKPGFYDNTDGLITQSKNVFLVVSTADCLPVLIYDKAKHVCAAIHSGWRGTEKNITGNALEMMKDKFGSLPEDIIIFIGPGISRKHFEVGEDVAALFDPKFVDIRVDKFFVNIIANVLEQIKQFGIKPAQIEYSRKCSFAEIEYLHSYRRDKEKSGRMFSVIGMKN